MTTAGMGPRNGTMSSDQPPPNASGGRPPDPISAHGL